MKLIFSALLTSLVTIYFYLIKDKPFWLKIKSKIAKQAIIGFFFGLCAIFATEFGSIQIGGAGMNCRDAAPLCAGLFFGGYAGIIAGFIGGIERFFCVYWGGAAFTRYACAIACVFAGFFAALLRKLIFDKEPPRPIYCVFIGMMTEAVHMLLVFITNISKLNDAYSFVKRCSIPMMLATTVSLFISFLCVQFIDYRNGFYARKKKKTLLQHFQIGLIVLIAIAAVVSFFGIVRVQLSIASVPGLSAEYMANVSIYITIIIETLVFGILFLMTTAEVKFLVSKNMEQVNDDLEQITSGELNTVVDVRQTFEFDVLSDEINVTVDKLKALIEDANARIDRELEFARVIQMASLPTEFNFGEEIDCYAKTTPAKSVGGDFYDIYQLDEKHFAFLIADVSGKGIPAAMFMMRARTGIKSLTQSGYTINEVFVMANSKLCKNNDAELFITAWEGILNIETGEINFVNAGHNPPLIKKKDGSFEYLKTKRNLVLGAMDGYQYKEGSFFIEPGDTIFLYTDGVTEAEKVNHSQYGEERLLETVNADPTQNAKEIVERVQRSVNEFADGNEQFDDITMLSLRYLKRKPS